VKVEARVCAVLLLASLSAGCMGYRIGNTPPGGIRSVHVPTFKNQTGEPLIESDATRAVIEAIQTDGSLKVMGAEHADSRLDVTLTSLVLEPVVYERSDAKVPEEYRLRIKAKVSLANLRTGKEILQRSVKGEKLFKPGGDLTTAKRTSMPKAAKDLAHQIVRAVVENW
jgi:hypothetical protein